MTVYERSLWPSVALAALLLVVGCAPARTTAARHRTLSAVNEHLRGREATVAFTSGATPTLWDVSVDPNVVRYRPGPEADHEEVPTEDVLRVLVPRQSGQGAGVAVGATPGLILTGIGLYAMSSDGTGYGAITVSLGRIATAAGLALVVIGGVVGGSIGDAAAPNGETLVYLGPVTRYAP